ncbi:ABC transporter permease [Calidithermus timidus]|jgi:peptide/nickel transport system permease protein|uniref:ABC transporter permease n=1 Tax=Calidithermus timidus TaxID=307124 RepID=UPI00037B76C8|nr:ABC transporter permease [Calidithermus timidus]
MLEPSLLRPLLLRALTLFGVLIAVLVLLAVSLGATGFSDKILQATVGEELRALRTSLTQTIRDPDQLEAALEARRKELLASYGLDRPWYTRIPGMVWRVLTLDLGEARNLRSYDGSSRIADIVLERLPNTIVLLTTATVITAVIGILAGVWMSTRVGSRLDRFIAYLAAVSYAVPTWWLGILLVLVLAFKLELLPPGGMYSAPPPEGGLARFLDLLWHSILPVLTLVLASVGPSIYSIRTLTLNIAQEDHVTVARAKGMPEPVVRNRHILRVAAPPIVTGLILGLAGSLGGSILVETIFDWRGMGRLYYDAIAGTPDEGLIVALTFMFTLLYVIARLILEVLYVWLDPRVRYEGGP